MINLKPLYSKLGLVICLFCLGPLSFADTSAYQVCFTPGQDCTGLIVKQIDAAKNNIWVQAYSFTSYQIGDALVRAEERGVNVQIIMDKSNFEPGAHGSAQYLLRHGIKIWNDYQLNIAHNKVMIFDNDIVETGSFNFTYAAQNHNAENVLIINSPQLAQDYLSNWTQRQKLSVAVQP
ncbi:MAG: phospholipase D family protein [Gammaproteobacteria bacterium]|nr:phospholipase D family protein [Gammaproteobacteria bacterium]